MLADKTYECKNKEIIPELVEKYTESNDIIVFMGAGDIYKSIEPVYNRLNE